MSDEKLNLHGIDLGQFQIHKTSFVQVIYWNISMGLSAGFSRSKIPRNRHGTGIQNSGKRLMFFHQSKELRFIFHYWVIISLSPSIATIHSKVESFAVSYKNWWFTFANRWEEFVWIKQIKQHCSLISMLIMCDAHGGVYINCKCCDRRKFFRKINAQTHIPREVNVKRIGEIPLGYPMVVKQWLIMIRWPECLLSQSGPQIRIPLWWQPACCHT